MSSPTLIRWFTSPAYCWARRSAPPRSNCRGRPALTRRNGRPRRCSCRRTSLQPAGGSRRAAPSSAAPCCRQPLCPGPCCQVSSRSCTPTRRRRPVVPHRPVALSTCPRCQAGRRRPGSSTCRLVRDVAADAADKASRSAGSAPTPSRRRLGASPLRFPDLSPAGPPLEAGRASGGRRQPRGHSTFHPRNPRTLPPPGDHSSPRRARGAGGVRTRQGDPRNGQPHTAGGRRRRRGRRRPRRRGGDRPRGAGLPPPRRVGGRPGPR